MQTPRELLDSLQRLRRGLRLWRIAMALLVLGTLLLWVQLLFVLSDWTFHWPMVVCWTGWSILMLLTAGSLGVLVWRLRQPLSPEHLSRRVEATGGDFHNRLINVVQFASSDDPQDQAFAAHLMRQQPLDLKGVSSYRLMPDQLLKSAVVLAGVALALSIGLALFNPVGYRVALHRLLLPMDGLAPHTLTRIASVTPGDATIPRGEFIHLEAEFSGLQPSNPVAVLQVGRQEATLPLEPIAEKPGWYGTDTPALYESTRYRISGGDALSVAHSLRVQSPPAIKRWSLRITPPEYTGLPNRQITSEQAEGSLPQGSQVELALESSQPLRRVVLHQAENKLAEHDLTEGASATLTGRLQSLAPLQLDLTSQGGLVGHAHLPLTVHPDQAPVVAFTTDEARLTAAPDATVALPWQASDHYGVATVRCELLDAERGVIHIQTVRVPAQNRQQVSGLFGIHLQELGAQPGSRLRFRLVATDFGPEPEQRQGISAPLDIIIPLPQEQHREQQQRRQSSAETIAHLIQLQQDNLTASRDQQTALDAGQAAERPAREALLTQQVAIRDLVRDLLRAPATLGDLQAILSHLLTDELTAANQALAHYLRAPQDEQAPPLSDAIRQQEAILASLRGLPQALDHEFAYQDKADLLDTLQQLVATQRRNLADAKAGQEANVQGDALASLVAAQERLADDAILFLDAAGAIGDIESDDDFARQIGKVHELLTGGDLYAQLLTAADQLGQLEWPAAIQTESECLTLLEEAMTLINSWRVKRAKRHIAEASKTFQEIAEELAKLEEAQKKIVERTRDLTRRGQLDQELRDELASMDEEQKSWLAKLEKMAQDLYQFPELPVANDLNSKMREVFEDVEQAAGSEHEPAVEIASQKEESLLNAIANTKERAEDVEMWLPDVPDFIKWNLESFDAQEFPEIPLVDLPDELEDIVGDLLKQDADIEMMSQDSTGNQIVADDTMGWAVMDAPMPSFSAKGKSGNTKPNDNEMTGRSGAGREGQSTGELVENRVKGLEGRQTHARKTNDPLQRGQVEEEESSTLDARSTGGGKLGGDSETIGTFGEAPRRDLHRQPGSPQRAIRQETEALYTTARLLFLDNTQELSQATRELQRVEQSGSDQREFESLQQRVLRRLQTSHVQLSTGAVLPMSSASQPKTGGGDASRDVDLEDVDDSFRDIVSDYYKNLGD